MRESLVEFEVAVVSEDDANLARLSAGLARELADAGAESVRPERLESVPAPGTKSSPIEWGKLIVEAASTGLAPIIAALAGWLARRPSQKVKLKWREGDREIEIECSESS